MAGIKRKRKEAEEAARIAAMTGADTPALVVPEPRKETPVKPVVKKPWTWPANLPVKRSK